MSVPVGEIIGVSTKIAEYFGLIDSVDSKMTKILHQAFNSATMNLEYALHASGQNQIEYIRQARIEFNQAVSVEENENKILALAGLSMCQSLLGDKANASVTCDMISQVELSLPEMAKAVAFDVAGGIGGLAGHYIGKKVGLSKTVFSTSNRLDNFKAVQQSAISMSRKCLL